MEVVFRAAVIYFFLWFITRVVGKRELGQMSAFELVLLVTMGDLIQQGVTQEDYSVTGAMLAVGTFALLMMSFAYLSWRFPRARPAFEGMPVVLVHDGVMQRDLMRAERLPDTELLEAMREQGIDDLSEVRVGILEPDGKSPSSRGRTTSRRWTSRRAEAGRRDGAHGRRDRPRRRPTARAGRRRGDLRSRAPPLSRAVTGPQERLRPG
jgi:hypothetical protein